MVDDQSVDENKTLPNGSKIIYAENEEKIVLYLRPQLDEGRTFVYDRKLGKIFVNGKEGSHSDKQEMIKLGAYMLGYSKETDRITVTYNNHKL